MASLELIHLTPRSYGVVSGQIVKRPVGSPLNGLPQICWKTGIPWREANLWLYERSSSRDVGIRTIVSNATALHAYAQWLEKASVDWWDFPARKADRCLVKYRGALVISRDEGKLAPSTVSARMRVVISFYRWLQRTGLLSPSWPTWSERVVGVRLTDALGFERTMAVKSTDLAIPNRTRNKEHLEDGLMPVSAAARDAILALAKQHASQEVHLMLALGFFTGMRLGSICDLKVLTLLNAIPDPAEPKIFRLSIGPGASPPVATKFGVTGQVIIPAVLLEQVRSYAYSPRHLHREALASITDRDRVFLTRFGHAYADRGADKSAAINVGLHRLRRIGVAHGLPIKDFWFHQTRATFATTVAEIAIRAGGSVNAIALVRDLLLHKDETTSLRYIKFVEKTPIKTELANEFTSRFFGSLVMRDKIVV